MRPVKPYDMKTVWFNRILARIFDLQRFNRET